MNRKYLILAIATFFMAAIFSCGNANENEENSDSTEVQSMLQENNQTTESYDPKRGAGKFDEINVPVEAFKPEMAAAGEGIAGTKCTSCHKLTDEKLVGPGWKGVTERRTLHWLMNFITNPDPMIDKDPEVQAQLELCLVRMPNQSLTDEDARQIVEYMRKNDGAK
jgi:mono/diheme cytochrome c family protein